MHGIQNIPPKLREEISFSPGVDHDDTTVAENLRSTSLENASKSLEHLSYPLPSAEVVLKWSLPQTWDHDHQSNHHEQEHTWEQQEDIQPSQKSSRKSFNNSRSPSLTHLLLQRQKTTSC